MNNGKLYFAVTVFLSLILLSPQVLANQYLGDVCVLAESASGNDDRLMKLGISHMGGNHFLFGGTWNWYDGSGKSTPINGNMELIDKKLEFTYTFAFYTPPSSIHYRVGHMELDVESLTGSLKMIKTNGDKETKQVSHGLSKMPVSLISCPE